MLYLQFIGDCLYQTLADWDNDKSDFFCKYNGNEDK